MSLKWQKTSSYKSVISRAGAKEAIDVQVGMGRSDPELTKTVQAISKVARPLHAKARSAGKYNWCNSDGNTFRSFRPKGGFKRDRRDGQLPARQQKAGKHIDLKALRNDGNPLRGEKGKKLQKGRF